MKGVSSGNPEGPRSSPRVRRGVLVFRLLLRILGRILDSQPPNQRSLCGLAVDLTLGSPEVKALTLSISAPGGSPSVVGHAE